MLFLLIFSISGGRLVLSTIQRTHFLACLSTHALMLQLGDEAENRVAVYFLDSQAWSKINRIVLKALSASNGRWSQIEL